MTADLRAQLERYTAAVIDEQAPITDAEVQTLVENIRELPELHEARYLGVTPLRRRILVAVVAAVVTLVLVGGLAWLGRSSQTIDPADQPAVTTPQSAPVPNQVPPDGMIGDGPFLVWKQISLPEVGPAGSVELFDDDHLVLLVSRSAAGSDVYQLGEDLAWRLVGSIDAEGTQHAAWDGRLAMDDGRNVRVLNILTGRLEATYELPGTVRQLAYGPAGLLAVTDTSPDTPYLLREGQVERSRSAGESCCRLVASIEGGFVGQVDRETYRFQDGSSWVRSSGIEWFESGLSDLVTAGDYAVGISRFGYIHRIGPEVRRVGRIPGGALRPGEDTNEMAWDLASDGRSLVAWQYSTDPFVAFSFDGENWTAQPMPDDGLSLAERESFEHPNNMALANGGVYLLALDQASGRYQLWQGTPAISGPVYTPTGTPGTQGVIVDKSGRDVTEIAGKVGEYAAAVNGQIGFPEPEFDTSGLGTEIPLMAANPSIVDIGIESCCPGGFADPSLLLAAAAHLDSDDVGPLTAVFTIQLPDFWLEVVEPGVGATSISEGFEEIPVVVADRAPQGAWIAIGGLPADASVVSTVLPDGSKLWQRPLNGIAIFSQLNRECLADPPGDCEPVQFTVFDTLGRQILTIIASEEESSVAAS